MDDNKLTLPKLLEAEEAVKNNSQYGPEQDIIRDVLCKYPYNTDIIEVAMKVSVIDVTNSTQLSKYKSYISLYDIAKIIAGISDFDERVAKGDESLVEEIAGKSKDLGVNLFSFASKYCHYHNWFVYERDDYSIFDSVVGKHLSTYSLTENPISVTTPNKWRKKIDYKAFNGYIAQILDAAGITIPERRRYFDHYVWFNNR